MNEVPDSYPIGKLCTEDPNLVSTKFSQKFHDFFQTVILKGRVIGSVHSIFLSKRVSGLGSTALPHDTVDR